MLCKIRRLTIGLALSLAGLACSRTPIDEQQAGVTGSTTLQEGFVPTGSMTSPRVNHTATLLTNQTVLMTGGIEASSGLATASAELYDPVAGYIFGDWWHDGRQIEPHIDRPAGREGAHCGRIGRQRQRPFLG